MPVCRTDTIMSKRRPSVKNNSRAVLDQLLFFENVSSSFTTREIMPATENEMMIVNP
jgi:hypothetical protein